MSARAADVPVQGGRERGARDERVRGAREEAVVAQLLLHSPRTTW